MTITCPTCGGRYHAGKRGEGAIYADNLKKPGDRHIHVINALLSVKDGFYTKNSLDQILRRFSINNNIPVPKGLDPYRARISELVRKNVLIMKTGNIAIPPTDKMPMITVKKPIYKLNRDYALKVLETGLY